jgi:hypothetical protein
MKIGSFLRGGLPPFIALRTNLGKGLPQTAKERGQLLSSVFGGHSLHRVVAPIHKSGWRRLTSSSGALHRPPYF